MTKSTRNSLFSLVGMRRLVVCAAIAAPLFVLGLPSAAHAQSEIADLRGKLEDTLSGAGKVLDEADEVLDRLPDEVGDIDVEEVLEVLSDGADDTTSERSDGPSSEEGTTVVPSDDDTAELNWWWSERVTVKARGFINSSEAVWPKVNCTSVRAVIDGQEFTGRIHRPPWHWLDPKCTVFFDDVPTDSSGTITIDGKFSGRTVRGSKFVTIGEAPWVGNTVDVGEIEMHTVSSGDNRDRDRPSPPRHEPPSTCKKKSIGDANCDGAVNAMDVAIWNLEYADQRQSKDADFNGDGRVDRDDFEIAMRNLGS